MKKSYVFIVFLALNLLISLPSRAQNHVDPNLTPSQQRTAWIKLSEATDTIKLYPRTLQPAIPAYGKALINPKVAFNTALLMIDQAEDTVDLSTYIFKEDDVGASILESLRQAIRRGVSVRVMFDSLGSFNLSHAAVKTLLAEERGFRKDINGNITNERAIVDVRIFNSISKITYHAEMLVKGLFHVVTGGRYSENDSNSFLRWVNRRSHDKMLLVDINRPNKSKIKIGGRNKDGDYYGEPDTNEAVVQRTYNDAEMLLRDAPEFPSELRFRDTIGQHFNYLFYHRGNKVLTPNWFESVNETHREKMRTGLKNTLPEGSSTAKLYAEMGQNFFTTGFELGKAHFVNAIENISRGSIFLRHTNPHHFANPNSIVRVFEEMIRRPGLKDIYVVSPYLLLTEKERVILMSQLRANPKLTLHVLTNSPLTTDNLPAQGEVDLVLGAMLLDFHEAVELKNQIKFYELGRNDSIKLGGKVAYGKLHAKFVATVYKDGSQDYVNMEPVADGAKAPTLEGEIMDMSHNLDKRSRDLNSEVGVHFTAADKEMIELANKLGIPVRDGATTPLEDFVAYFKSLETKSYEVASKEYAEMISRHELANKVKNSARAYNCARRIFHLDKLI